MKIKYLSFLFIATCAFLVLKNAYADNDIVVSDAWVQAVPSVSSTTAAYLTLTNNSSQEEILTSVSSDAAASTEVHAMNEANGMMRMAMVASLHVPSGDKIVFAPGGFHIMLINLKKPLNVGDKISIILHFKDGTSVTFIAPVKSQQEQDSSSSMAEMKM